MAITEERFRAVEIQVAVLKESMEYIGKYRDKNLATKADISALRSEFKGDIGALRSEFKGDIGVLRSEFKGDIGVLRAELKEDIGNLKDRVGNLEGTNKWLLGIGISILLGVLYQIVEPIVSGFLP